MVIGSEFVILNLCLTFSTHCSIICTLQRNSKVPNVVHLYVCYLSCIAAFSNKHSPIQFVYLSLYVNTIILLMRKCNSQKLKNTKSTCQMLLRSQIAYRRPNKNVKYIFASRHKILYFFLYTITAQARFYMFYIVWYEKQYLRNYVLTLLLIGSIYSFFYYYDYCVMASQLCGRVGR